MSDEEIYIGTNNQKIIEFVKNKRIGCCTTHITCAHCGKNNKISNYEFINNFEVYYVEKGFSVIEFTCYHCKEKYDLSASINTFSPKIIEESFETALTSINKITSDTFKYKSIGHLSRELVNSEINTFINSLDKKSDQNDIIELKNELKNISQETLEFLVNCGMNTMNEIYKRILNDSKQGIGK